MKAFATVEQYEARYGDVLNTKQVEECLASAASVMMDALDTAQIDYSEPDEKFAYALMDVCRSVANRIMPQPNFGIPSGATSASMGAVGFSESYSFATPYGSPKLRRDEKRRLGIGTSQIFSVRVGGWDEE